MAKPSEVVTELRALAGSEVALSGDFTIRRGGRAIGVTFTTDSDDDVQGMTLSVEYDVVARRAERAYRDAGRPLVATRPLAIELRRERAADLVAKDSGVSVEWQSGDALFDREVYVSSPTTDAHVLGEVLSVDARRAVLELLDLGFEQIEIDVDGKVAARIGAAKLDGPSKQPERTVTAFDALASSLPAIVASGEKRPGRPLAGWTRVLGLVGAVGWGLNVGYAGLVGMGVELVRPGRRDVSPPWWAAVGCVVFGILAGIVGAWVWMSLIERLDRGSSDTHTRSGMAGVSAFGGFSVLAFTAALVACLLWLAG